MAIKDTDFMARAELAMEEHLEETGQLIPYDPDRRVDVPKFEDVEIIASHAANFMHKTLYNDELKYLQKGLNEFFAEFIAEDDELSLNKDATIEVTEEEALELLESFLEGDFDEQSQSSEELS